MLVRELAAMLEKLPSCCKSQPVALRNSEWGELGSLKLAAGPDLDHAHPVFVLHLGQLYYYCSEG